MINRHKVKNEIPHEELLGKGSASARYTEVGFKQQIHVINQVGQIQNTSGILQDKVIYKINVCPHCGSEVTFHRIIQENNDVVGNVWRAEEVLSEKGSVYKKFDYCLDCHKEFLIELYIWAKE